MGRCLSFVIRRNQVDKISQFFDGLVSLLPKFKLGKIVEHGINGVINGPTPVLDAIKNVLLWFMLRIENFLNWMPWWLFIILIIALGCWLYNWKKGIVLGALLFLVVWIDQWDLMCNSLTIVFTTLILCALIGIPVGILMACSDRAESIIKPILDAMQVIPLFVYFLPVIMLFGIGRVPSLLASLIFSLPPIIKLTNLGIRQVPRSTVIAADAFGCTRAQKLMKVQIPLSAESIAMGLNQTTIVSLGMSISASVIGCKGLGLELYAALCYLDIGRAFNVGLVIFAVAIMLDRLTQGIARKLMR